MLLGLALWASWFFANTFIPSPYISVCIRLVFLALFRAVPWQFPKLEPLAQPSNRKRKALPTSKAIWRRQQHAWEPPNTWALGLVLPLAFRGMYLSFLCLSFSGAACSHLCKILESFADGKYAAAAAS